MYRDIDRYLDMFKEAWRINPDMEFMEVLREAGVSLQSSDEDLEECLNQFILNNM